MLSYKLGIAYIDWRRPANTVAAAPSPELIHPGVYLRLIGGGEVILTVSEARAGNSWSSFRDAPLGAGPESILPIVVMDSGLARFARARNDEAKLSLAELNYFFTSGQAGSGGPNASSPEIFARIL
jgi:hypothetical protein